MSQSSTVPGVSVAEPRSLSIGISSAATAIPVFVFNPFLIKDTDLINDKFEMYKHGLMTAPVTTFSEMSAQTVTSGKEGVPSPEAAVPAVSKFTLHRIENWSDYLDLMGGTLSQINNTYTSTIVVKSATLSHPERPHNYILNGNGNHAITFYLNSLQALGYFSLMHYFENGGGACYFCLYSQSRRALLDQSVMRGLDLPFWDPDYTKINATDYDFEGLKKDILSHPDITLLCLCGDPQVNMIMHEALSELMSGKPALFCLTASDQNEDTIVFKHYEAASGGAVTAPNLAAAVAVDSYPSAANYPEHTAAYYPYLKTRHVLTLGDLNPDHIHLEDYHGEISANDYEKQVKDAKDNNQNIPKPDDKLSTVLKVNPGLVQRMLSEVVREVVVPPTAAIAGAYCRTDNQHGVWKAPANVVLSGVKGLCDSRGEPVFVTDSVNTKLHRMQVNAVRYSRDKGHVVWGARTRVAGSDMRWTYVPVRRLFDTAERDILEAMQAAVFEPNTAATWGVVRTAIDSYLHDIWSRGGLAGDKPEQAWYVHLGLGLSMTPKDVLDGKMIVKVGMAPVKPAEFIVLEFSQLQAG